MTFEPGAKLGPYEILELVSESPAESYKATDTRLNRTVTIKLFPRDVWQNQEGRRQLEQEIEALAALNHPNVCAVYDVGEEANTGFIVTDFVGGETLAQRLTQGPVELDEALKIAIAVADGLDAAHRQGVAHRGLNPSNILLNSSGVKVADFGLLQLIPPSNPPASTSSLVTKSGTLRYEAIPASVAPYLAPEQFDGSEGDARTDIFAFGAILYELVTGQPAFEGKTGPVLLAAIQTLDPEPLSKLQPMAPPALEYVVERCLAKDPRQRLQTARDLSSQLKWISGGGSQIGVPAVVAARRRKRDHLLWLAAAGALVLALGLSPWAYRYLQGAPDPEEVRFIVYSMPDTAFQQNVTPVTVSPDGRWMASSRLAVYRGIYLLAEGSVTPKILLQDHTLYAPFWSPDSRSFAFFEDGKLKISDITGASPQTVADALPPIGGGTWGSDGVIVFASQGLLYRVPAAGGQATKISTLNPQLQEGEHAMPHFLPDGRHYLYLSVASDPLQSAVYVASLDSTEATRLFSSESAALYADPGYLLFNRATAVFAQRFDAEELKPGRGTNPHRRCCSACAVPRSLHQPGRREDGELRRFKHGRPRLPRRIELHRASAAWKPRDDPHLV